MLSLLSFRRPALFIKALDGYLSQYCRIHPQKLPSLLSSLPFPNLFLLPSNVPASSSPSLNPSIPLVLNPSLPLSLLNQTLKSLQIFFHRLCVTSVLSRQMKQQEFGFNTVITCNDNNPLVFFPCGSQSMLAFWKFICIFVSPLFLLMNYLLQSEMTAEVAADCCSGWMGTFLLFVIIPFSLIFNQNLHSSSPVTTVGKRGSTHLHFSIAGGTFTLAQWECTSLCCPND